MNTLAQQLRRIGASGAEQWRRQSVRAWAPICRVGRHQLTYGLMARNQSAAARSERTGARSSRLEAVLFLAREPLTLRKMAQLANLTDGTEVRTLLSRLRQRYDERGCAFQVAQVAGGYQLLSRREFARWLRPQTGTEQETRLSPPALETLAVVAYRQPVLRAEVEAIRGVVCGDILRQLMDRDLLRIVGRSEELGRPLQYGTTRRFLQVFGLCNLEQLPWAARLRRAASAETNSSGFLSVLVDSGAGLTDDVNAA